ncbi:MAG: ornithine carbamoyltransferase [Holosporales bacterium]|jgi:ornithine carbamoyltransferase
MPRHFLDISDHDAATLTKLLDSAAVFKKNLFEVRHPHRALLCIFEKPSTRTRVSFERAAWKLGAQAIILRNDEMQLGRGESISDTARVLSRYGDALMLRTTTHARLMELSTFSTIPVINALTDKSHPCQILADLLTCIEAGLNLGKMTVAWIGDPNNVWRSWYEAAAVFGFTLRTAAPEVLWKKAAGYLTTDPLEAVREADVIVTDTWVSMGFTDVLAQKELLRPYQVTPALMAAARASAIFLHCLPAVRGEEVVDAVIDGMQSRVLDEAENRLHVQTALLDWLWT